MLHITNGDCANEFLRKSCIQGHFQAWHDVLHDGPITAETNLTKITEYRARFLADYFDLPLEHIMKKFRQRDDTLNAYNGETEIVLWLTPELFDALIGLQFLAWYQAEQHPISRLKIVMLKDHLPPRQLDAKEVKQAFTHRESPDEAFLALAEKVWNAVSCGEPREVESCLQMDFSAWPTLKPAMRRYLEEIPVEGHLTRTQKQILASVHKGAKNLAHLFGCNQKLETTPFMGDLSFWCNVESLKPLIVLGTKESIKHQPVDFYHMISCRLTDEGKRKVQELGLA